MPHPSQHKAHRNQAEWQSNGSSTQGFCIDASACQNPSMSAQHPPSQGMAVAGLSDASTNHQHALHRYPPLSSQSAVLYLGRRGPTQYSDQDHLKAVAITISPIRRQLPRHVSPVSEHSGTSVHCCLVGLLSYPWCLSSAG